MKKPLELAVAVATLMVAYSPPPAAAQSSADDQVAAAVRVVDTRRSWTADRMEFAIGDVITVLIDERTLASATTGDIALDRRSRDLFATADQSVSTAFPRMVGRLGSTNDAESRQRGESVRQNRFVGEMTARVVAVENGFLQIRGERNTSVDRNQQTMSLTGWVRAQDISPDNLIESWRIGDAEILYASNGNLGKPRGGFITRFIGWIWP